VVKGFVGRRALLERLQGEVDGIRTDGSGRFVTIRGRRRVGKSWLVEEFVERSRLPFVFFAASGQTPERELSLFAEKLSQSTLPSAELATNVRFETWEAALVAASSQASAVRPSVIVLDEFPDLCDLRRDGDGRVTGSPQEGSVRAAWDQVLSRRPVLLILIGSDLSMMEALTSYGRPLHQRPTRELVVPPLNPREVAAMSKRTGADALEAYLVTGGFPKIAAAWQEGDLQAFLARSLIDDGSPLVSTGHLILEAEFRSSVQARSVLAAVGTGSRTNKAISDASGIRTSNLTYPLKVLAEKRVVATSLPLSIKPSVDRRYAVSDPYLRFYLRFLDRGYGEIERGRGRVLVPEIMRSWETYLGLAIEPIIRAAIENLLPDDRFGLAQAVGGFWTRDHRVEVDLVGADRGEPPVRAVSFIGSIKWRQRKPATGSDVAELIRTGSAIAGVTPDTPIVLVSRSGITDVKAPLAAAFEPDELLASFPLD
jgi:AAA+ ATPase superfamily predicted ATPase